MKKSTLLMVLSLVLAIALGVGSTLAYLTDTDADKNVMTVGRVSIVQNEQQRVEQDGQFTDPLEPFEDNKMVLPYTPREGDADKVTVGDHELELSDTKNNYIDKIVSVTNTSNVDVYVRTLVAVPTGGSAWEPTPAADADSWLHWETPQGGDDHWTLNTTPVDIITVDEVNYYVWEFVHKEAVAPQEITYPVIRGLYMDSKVDMDDKGYYIADANGNTKRIEDFLDAEGKLNVLVLSQAVQADGFADPTTAMTQAFPYGDDAANVEKWFTGWTADDIGSPGDKNDTNDPPVFSIAVKTAEELVDALRTYDEITLEGNISADAYEIGENADVDINLGGNTLTGSITNNGDVKISGDGILESSVAGIVNNGDAEISNVKMNAGSTADYAAISLAGSETVYDNLELDSAGGGIGAVDGAQVTFKSGSIAVNTASTSGRYNFYAEGDGTVITIEDGTFSFSKTLNQKRAYIYAGAGTTVYVKGGNFGPASTRSGYTAGILGAGDVIITGGTFGFDPSAWVADGYQAVKTENTWIVSAIN